VSNLATLSGVALAKSHADYDNDTAHGRTQGAVFQMP
jgi:hypothetical protein